MRLTRYFCTRETLKREYAVALIFMLCYSDIFGLWSTNNFKRIVYKFKNYYNIFILKPSIKNNFFFKCNKPFFANYSCKQNTNISSAFWSFKFLNKLCPSTFIRNGIMKIHKTYTHIGCFI